MPAPPPCSLAGSALASATQGIAAYPSNTWAKADLDETSFVNLYPADGVPRATYASPPPAPVPAGEPMSEAPVDWSEVRRHHHGEPADCRSLVPQMLNFESVGGVNFKKGCYPGQEVGTRSQASWHPETPRLSGAFW